MRCDIKIMASPKRYSFVQKMCHQLNLDIDKDVFFDDRPNGGDAAYTSRKTWELPWVEGVTHRCVLQDDLLLSDGFSDAIQLLVNKFSDSVFTLFCPSSKLKEDKFCKNSPQIIKIKKCGVWGQAIIIPKKYALKMYEWGAVVAGDAKIVHDDVLIGEYALNHSIDVFTTVPSLVQHLCPTNSLLGFNRKEKISKVFDENAGMLDWSNASCSLSITAPNSMKFYR